MYSLASVSRKPFVQVAYLSILALLIHAIVLKFIFPGYYSPLFPHHSDFYIPVALAHSPDMFFQYKYLGHSRPLGILFLKLMGFLGIHGAILFTIINVMINCSLSATLLRRIAGIDFGWPFVLGYCLYCYLLFSQPYFYTFYTQDVLSHISYFFLIAGASFFYKWHDSRRVLAYNILFCCSVIAFLCKETYGPAAIVFAFLWWWYYRKGGTATAIAPLLLTGGALVAVLCFNIMIKSAFINLEASTTDPYFINLKPGSVFKEFYLYAAEGLNFCNLVMIALIGWLVVVYSRGTDKKGADTKGTDKKMSYLFWGCIVAAICSWIPNALIPNHHNGGYSFNGAYLLYLPIIFVPLLWGQRILVRCLAVVLCMAGLCSPLASPKAYAGQWWVLEQENTQRNLLHSLDSLMGGLKAAGPGQSILVTGLTMPFYPFHHPMALESFPDSKLATYDVVNYSLTTKKERDYPVKFVGPADVQLTDYSAVWMFAGNGSLIRDLAMDTAVLQRIVKNNGRDLVLYPDSAKNRQLALIIAK